MLAVSRVEILHPLHDRATLSLILLVPAIQIVLFGYAVNLNPKKYQLLLQETETAAALRNKSATTSIILGPTTIAAAPSPIITEFTS
jgi:hypothetical protein